MGKYFNKDAEDGIAVYQRLRVEPTGGDESGENGYQVLKGGIVNSKGRLTQADTIAWCETKEEAERLLELLCSIA